MPLILEQQHQEDIPGQQILACEITFNIFISL